MHDAPGLVRLLGELRAAAATACALERLALVGSIGDHEELAQAWKRADAAARAILEERCEPCPTRSKARYEANLWLEGGLGSAQSEPPLPGPVPGSLEAASLPGLVAMCESIEGLAEVTRVALDCAGAMACSARSLAEADPDASHALGLVADFAHRLAASAAERLEAREPRSRDAAYRRASALLAQRLASADARAIERAAMIAMQAGLEHHEPKH